MKQNWEKYIENSPERKNENKTEEKNSLNYLTSSVKSDEKEKR